MGPDRHREIAASGDLTYVRWPTPDPFPVTRHQLRIDCERPFQAQDLPLLAALAEHHGVPPLASVYVGVSEAEFTWPAERPPR